MHIHWLVELLIHFFAAWFVVASVLVAIAEAVDMDRNGVYGNDSRQMILTLISVASMIIAFEIMWWGRWA